MLKFHLSLRLQYAWAALSGDFQKARIIEGQLIMSQLSDAVTSVQAATTALSTAASNVQTYVTTLQADSADGVSATAALGTVAETLTNTAATLNGLVPAPAAPAIDPATGLPAA